MSITDETILAYLNRGSQLWKRAAKDFECETPNLHPMNFVDWLIKLLPTLKPSSRRQYLACSREWLEYKRSNPSNTSEVKEAFSESIFSLAQYQSSSFTSTSKVSPRRGNTSSQKSKQFKDADLLAFIKAVNISRRKWAIPAKIWVLANIFVGLRPSEWKNAYFQIIGEEKFLVVVNAKNTNQRSHGKLRHLNLTKMYPDALGFVLEQLKIASKYKTDDDSWLKYYNGVRLTIHRIVRDIFPNRRKYPSLYSTRHQFAANLKAAEFTKCEIAALMGHAVDTTATMHYGRKRHGSGSFGVKPAADEVARIRVRSEPQPSNKPKM